MATQEIYIRNQTDTEARGPFNVEQISSLADAGQVTGETLVYDSTTEQWVALSANPELMAAAFPEKKKLSLKAKEIKTLNKPDENAKAITVNDMLAAAEGRTEDTKGKSDPEIAMMRAAKVGLIGATVTLVAAAAAEILPATEALTSMDPAKIMAQPLVILGVVDVILAVLLGLGMSTIYSFVRFRAALGFGLMGFMFYAQGLSLPLIEVAAGAAGLYLCTVFVTLIPVIVAAAAGIGGMGMLAWYFLSH
ncbi:MAG: DUF4339 domain-containing protein [Verrucomicrobia bacterium]|nr:DUF4339 domain-containing protein [Verrucomicrobiota bacterium]